MKQNLENRIDEVRRKIAAAEAELECDPNNEHLYCHLEFLED